MKVSEAKRGQVVEIDGELWTIGDMDFTKPGKGPGYYQITFKNLARGNLRQRRMQGDDQLTFAFLENREMEYLYQEGDDYVLMDTESYEQVTLPGDTVRDTMQYVRLNAKVKVQFYEDKLIGVDLPAAVVLKVTETDPSARGDTVKNVTKPATLETGLVVKVPAHVNEGTFVKVDTRTGDFISRASDNEIPADE
jgi:elongation factor P